MSNQPKLNLPTEYQVARISGFPKPIFFRPIEEDIYIIRSIFEQGEYTMPLKNFSPKLILDCGGNIGCAAVYFANKFPDAQIYSVEPEKKTSSCSRSTRRFTKTFTR